MPKDTIERAVAKGSGTGADGSALEELTYEAYGPGRNRVHHPNPHRQPKSRDLGHPLQNHSRRRQLGSQRRRFVELRAERE